MQRPSNLFFFCLPLAVSLFFLCLDHESHPGYESCGDNIRDPADLQRPTGTSQGGVETKEHGKRSKSQAKIGNKTQPKEQGRRTGAARTKVRRPGSPYHVSALTVYQKEGGKGFISSKNEAEQRDEEPAAGDNGSDFPSSDLRAKWFLSTSQWQGCIPLQISDFGSSSNEEASDVREHLARSEDVTDSNEMSSAVSESLEKMKENHSLFYKIACDISISDTDIEKNDGNSNGQTSPRPDVEEGEEQLVITEGVQEEDTIKAGMSSDQKKEKSSRRLPSHDSENIPSADGTIQHPAQEIPDKFAVHMSEIGAQEEISQPGLENTRTEEDQSENDKEEVQAPPAQSADCNTTVEENKKRTETGSEAKDSEDRNVDQKRSRKMRKCFSLSEESAEVLRELGNAHDAPSGSAYEGRSVTRSASFGKARVTVLRTSL